MTWSSKNHYVDIETGEQLDAKIAKKKYLIIKKTIKHEKINEWYGTKHITNLCQPNRQRTIW